MHPEIKDIIPESYLFDDERYSMLNENVTYIIRIAERNSRKVYSFEDYIDSLDLEINCMLKLRFHEDIGKSLISYHTNATSEPQGVVLNMSEIEAENFERELLFPLLMQKGDAFTIQKINNCEIAREKQKEQADIFRSLFTVE